ncbi:DnaD domain protein [Thermoactinomyces sp. DSM 45892]|uniref:DnaD domain protein n=1 Tax=Thermoactinomyces sp. DSM 45892 TaxID=1882753 RepID=UPI00089C6E0D|nr:DnaD domain protein [Thermoactinomyces sp. DSM 45892]SDY85463.1 DnaD and phage-associated domain-containing protein [Thermoactinomyces sp. DSM 45892]
MSKNETWINARRRNHTTLDDSFIQDARITLQAKGLLTVIISEEKYYDSEKAKKIELLKLTEKSANGRDAHFNVANELERYGYIRRVRTIDENNKFSKIYYIFSDNTEEVKMELESLENALKEEGTKYFVMTDGKGKRKKVPHPENPDTESQDKEKNEKKAPHPENPDTGNPDTESQDDSTLVLNTKAFVLNTYVCMYVCDVIEKFKYFFPNKGSKYTEITISDLCQSMSIPLVEAAVERAVFGEASHPVAYVKNVLKRWKAAEVQTIEDVDQYEKQFYEKRKHLTSDNGKVDLGTVKQGKKRSTTTADQKLPKSVAQQLEREKNGESYTPASPEQRAIWAEQLNKKMKQMNDALVSKSNEFAG